MEFMAKPKGRTTMQRPRVWDPGHTFCRKECALNYGALIKMQCLTVGPRVTGPIMSCVPSVPLITMAGGPSIIPGGWPGSSKTTQRTHGSCMSRQTWLWVLTIGTNNTPWAHPMTWWISYGLLAGEEKDQAWFTDGWTQCVGEQWHSGQQLLRSPTRRNTSERQKWEKILPKDRV